MTAVKSKAAATAKLGRKRDAAATRQALVEAAAVVFKSGCPRSFLISRPG